MDTSAFTASDHGQMTGLAARKASVWVTSIGQWCYLTYWASPYWPHGEPKMVAPKPRARVYTAKGVRLVVDQADIELDAPVLVRAPAVGRG